MREPWKERGMERFMEPLAEDRSSERGIGVRACCDPVNYEYELWVSVAI